MIGAGFRLRRRDPTVTWVSKLRFVSNSDQPQSGDQLGCGTAGKKANYAPQTVVRRATVIAAMKT
jgi:hypothetical protein